MDLAKFQRISTFLKYIMALTTFRLAIYCLNVNIQSFAMQTTTSVFQVIVVTDVESEEVYILVLYNITDDSTISGPLNITIETSKHCRQPYCLNPPIKMVSSYGTRNHWTEHNDMHGRKRICNMVAFYITASKRCSFCFQYSWYIVEEYMQGNSARCQLYLNGCIITQQLALLPDKL